MLMLYVIPYSPFPFPRWWGGSPPAGSRPPTSKWQPASHLQQANKPFNQSACQPQGKETPEKLIQRIRWLEEKQEEEREQHQQWEDK